MRRQCVLSIITRGCVITTGVVEDDVDGEEEGVDVQLRGTRKKLHRGLTNMDGTTREGFGSQPSQKAGVPVLKALHGCGVRATVTRT